MYIRFLNSNAPIECVVVPNGNIVTLQFADNVVVNTSGFRAYLDAECTLDVSGDSYIGFTTIYRNDEETAKYNGYQLSNDGSIWIRPLYETVFIAGSGGYLKGKTTQSVYNYEDLVVPVPVAESDYDFSHWSPEVPVSGVIEGNKTYTAIFVSNIPIPEPTPEPSGNLDKRVATLEEDVRKINEALGGTLNE